MKRRTDRRYECRRCGLVVIERWHGPDATDFTSEPPTLEACPRHLEYPGRGAHDFEVSTPTLHKEG